MKLFVIGGVFHAVGTRLNFNKRISNGITADKTENERQENESNKKQPALRCKSAINFTQFQFQD